MATRVLLDGCFFRARDTRAGNCYFPLPVYDDLGAPLREHWGTRKPEPYRYGQPDGAGLDQDEAGQAGGSQAGKDEPVLDSGRP